MMTDLTAPMAPEGQRSPLSHPEHELELDEAVCKSELTLAKILGNCVLGDPKTDTECWCEKFLMWRKFNKVNARTAAHVLQSRLPVTEVWLESYIDMKWAQSGRLPPRSTQDWEEYLSFSLDVVASEVSGACRPTRAALNKEWEDLVQGNENATQFAGRIKRLAHKLSEQSPPIIKSMADIQDKFMAGVHPSLRKFLQFAHAMTKGVEKQSPAEADEHFSALVRYTKAHEDITARNAVYSNHSQRHPVQDSQINASSASSNPAAWYAVSREQ